MLPTIKLHIERWRFNKDYGVYVSTYGHFRNRDKADLPIKVNQQGYCCVKVDCTTVNFMLAHRLVMLTWRPTDEAENLTVDHKDHNKRNNSLENLEWVTYEENIVRAQKDFINTAITEKTPIGQAYGELYSAFIIDPVRAPASNYIKDVITVKNDDMAINSILAAIKKQMQTNIESRKIKNKIKTMAKDKNIEKVACYGFDITGVRA